MRHALVAICLLALCGAASAQENENFTVVLHARTPAGTGSCTASGLPDCLGIRPTTQVAANNEFRLYIFINNFSKIFALLTAFAWPTDWSIVGDEVSVFGCRGATQAYAHVPVEPGGPLEGTLATAFDCVSGPGLAAIARIDFFASGGGCLTQLNPRQGTGRVEVLDCQYHSTTLDASDPRQQPRLGSICVGVPGRDACDALVAFEPVTWGKIKASYQ